MLTFPASSLCRPCVSVCFQMQAKKDPECVKVVVRCRPMSKKETEDGRKRIVEMDGKTGEVWFACCDVRFMLLRCEGCPVVWRTCFGDHLLLMLCILPMVLYSIVKSCLSLAADQCAEAVAELCFFVALATLILFAHVLVPRCDDF